MALEELTPFRYHAQDMATYNKQVAEELLRELQELLKPYPERIKEVSNDGPIIDIICEGLGKAISSLQTTI